MASRKEQKEKARQQRLEQERARAAAARRARRMRLASGTVLGIAALVAVGVAVGLGNSGKKGSGNPITPVKSDVKLPAQKVTDLAAAAKAAKAAKCVMVNTPDSIARTDQNRQHVQVGTQVKYATNPPSFGPHYPVPAHDGEYKPSGTPPIEYLVHALEHGRIEYEYRPGLAPADVKTLEALMEEPEGSYGGGQLMVMFQNPTNMPYDVAAVAWGHILGCKTFNPDVIDAFRAFRLAYTDKGPEQLGLGPE